jgi:hypothetical protein
VNVTASMASVAISERKASTSTSAAIVR